MIPERTGNGAVFWFNREYLQEAMEPRGGLRAVGMIWIRADRPENVEPIMRAVDALFRNSEAETAAETEKSFFASFFGSLEAFVQIILVVTGLVALCVLCIAANTASMTVRERGREIAVLRAIGFGRGLVFATLVAESAVLAIVAGSTGALLTYGFSVAVRAFAGEAPQSDDITLLTLRYLGAGGGR